MGLKIMQMLGRLLDNHDSETKRSENRVFPALRLFTAIFIILLCSLSRNALFTVSVIAVLLARTAMMSPESVRRILKPVILPCIFTAIIMLPAVFTGQPGTMLTVTMKVFESVLILSLLNYDVSWREMTESLRFFHLPQIIIFSLDIMIRFLAILGRFMVSVLEAVGLRRVGEKNWKNAATGGILGVTYLKSHQMSAQTSEAMECRCFSGEYRTLSHRRLNKYTVLYSLIIPVSLAWFLMT